MSDNVLWKVFFAAQKKDSGFGFQVERKKEEGKEGFELYSENMRIANGLKQ